MLSLYTFLMLLMTFIPNSYNEILTCNYNPPKKEEVIRNVKTSVYAKHKRSSTPKPIRIKLYYDGSVAILPADKERVVKSVFPTAIDYWEKTLMLGKSTSILRLAPSCRGREIMPNSETRCCLFGCTKRTKCGDIVIPREHLQQCKQTYLWSMRQCIGVGPVQGMGIPDTDFILYVSAKQTDRCADGNTFAYAAHCQLEATLDRPIAGYINLCPELLGSSTPNHIVSVLLPTIKHEILHALGFSVSLYAFYRDSDGNPLTPRLPNGDPVYNSKINLYQWSKRVIQQVTRPDWEVASGNITRMFHLVVTPNVLREAMLHFNCSSIEGVELENQGNYGTAMTHWEKRIFENEAMTGTHTQNTVFSRITLALMEDTGWYKVNYDMAEELSWGKNMGCDFVKKNCYSWIRDRLKQNQDPHPYCVKIKTHPLITECSLGGKSLAVCNLVKYGKPLSPEYQNFNSLPGMKADSSAIQHYGGSVALADYCPFVQEFIFKLEKYSRAFECLHPENLPVGPENFGLEYYGDNSSCLEHSIKWEKSDCFRLKSWYHYGSGCYKHTCNRTGLYIHVLNYTFRCDFYQQKLNFRISHLGWFHSGGLVCPACESLCQDPQLCSNYRQAPQDLISNEKIYLLPDKSLVTCSGPSLFPHNIPHFRIYYYLLFFASIYFISHSIIK